ncbi:sensor histidine kinase [Scatolibacter rhodanostii]|uniref:sensor histidine kinase n=1 Tax=Scatolibacter rhodanostii TaxID=2014781 RepID=UPI0013565433|nr:histidine kinase [Scatolibacter rhodanostii]
MKAKESSILLQLKKYSKQPKSIRTIMAMQLCIVALLCIFMVFLMAVRTLDLAEKNRFQTALRTYTEQLDKQINQEFDSIVNISQQMLPVGNIGSMVESYLNAESPYEKMSTRKWLDSLIGQSAFSSNQIELVAYCEYPALVWVGNMKTQADFDPIGNDMLSQTTDITFQSIHNTANRFTNSEVFSIIRPVLFSDDIPRYIYLEYRTDIASSMEALEKEQGIPYKLIQLDNNNVVRYSLAEDIAVGDTFDLSGQMTKTADMSMGRGQKYVWCYAPAKYGFKNVLLLPENYYDYERMTLYRDILLFIMLALLIILMLSFLFRNQMYRPLKLIENEIMLTGKGDMAIRKHPFQIQEYQVLYERFLHMKNQISGLMEDIVQGEREKRRLELDKLYFQINPHFIMNALNSAQWQARMEKQPAIADYLSHLNFILAYTLGKVNQNTTLNSEIKMLMEYLELQQTRQDFEVHTVIEPGLYLDEPCARLILQPVAENAVCHSLNDFGNLWIEIHTDDQERVEIKIRDDGAGFNVEMLSYKEALPLEGERQAHNGIGLRYVWLTLQEFYGSSAEMDIASEPQKGTLVTIRFPIHRDEKKPPNTEDKK